MKLSIHLFLIYSKKILQASYKTTETTQLSKDFSAQVPFSISQSQL